MDGSPPPRLGPTWVIDRPPNPPAGVTVWAAAIGPAFAAPVDRGAAKRSPRDANDPKNCPGGTAAMDNTARTDPARTRTRLRTTVPPDWIRGRPVGCR